MATPAEIKDIENRINKFCNNLAKEVVEDLAPLEVSKKTKPKDTKKETSKNS